MCLFQRQQSILCHRLDREGIHKTQDKIEAVTRAPSPQNVSQLCSFLRLINYYNWLLPNLSTQLAPLYHPIKKGQKWCWSRHCQQSFEAVKELVSSDQMLASTTRNSLLNFLVMQVHMVLVQYFPMFGKMPRNDQWLLHHAHSRAEENYSQIDKEALALVWGYKTLPPVPVGSNVHTRN